MKSDKAEYDLWKGFSIVCPDLKKDEQFYIMGGISSFATKDYQFKIDRCN